MSPTFEMPTFSWAFVLGILESYFLLLYSFWMKMEHTAHTILFVFSPQDSIAHILHKSGSYEG